MGHSPNHGGHHFWWIQFVYAIFVGHLVTISAISWSIWTFSYLFQRLIVYLKGSVINRWKCKLTFTFCDYSKTCLKRPLKKKTKNWFSRQLSLNAGQKYCGMLQKGTLQYFRPALSYHLSLRPLFCLFLSGRLRNVLLYNFLAHQIRVSVVFTHMRKFYLAYLVPTHGKDKTELLHIEDKWHYVMSHLSISRKYNS